MGRVHSYRSGNVEVQFDTARCIHAAECVRGLPQVFDPKRTPWVLPGEAEPEAVKAVVLRCPTGALRFVRDGRIEGWEGPPQVRLAADGPLLLRGPFELRLDPEAPPVAADRVALCRCGASARKPYCDGAHRTCGFKAPAALEAPPTALAEASSEEVSLQPAANGPLLLGGAVEIRDEAGALLAIAAKPALCRCGASARKPFCDGAHRACGFVG